MEPTVGILWNGIAEENTITLAFSTWGKDKALVMYHTERLYKYFTCYSQRVSGAKKAGVPAHFEVLVSELSSCSDTPKSAI